MALAEAHKVLAVGKDCRTDSVVENHSKTGRREGLPDQNRNVPAEDSSEEDLRVLSVLFVSM